MRNKYKKNKIILLILSVFLIIFLSINITFFVLAEQEYENYSYIQYNYDYLRRNNTISVIDSKFDYVKQYTDGKVYEIEETEITNIGTLCSRTTRTEGSTETITIKIFALNGTFTINISDYYSIGFSCYSGNSSLNRKIHFTTKIINDSTEKNFTNNIYVSNDHFISDEYLNVLRENYSVFYTKYIELNNLFFIFVILTLITLLILLIYSPFYIKILYNFKKYQLFKSEIEAEEYFAKIKRLNRNTKELNKQKKAKEKLEKLNKELILREKTINEIEKNLKE
jgi:hypothetical protein